MGIFHVNLTISEEEEGGGGEGRTSVIRTLFTKHCRNIRDVSELYILTWDRPSSIVSEITNHEFERLSGIIYFSCVFQFEIRIFYFFLHDIQVVFRLLMTQ